MESSQLLDTSKVSGNEHPTQCLPLRLVLKRCGFTCSMAYKIFYFVWFPCPNLDFCFSYGCRVGMLVFNGWLRNSVKKYHILVYVYDYM